MQTSKPQSRVNKPFRQLIADMMLWLVLVILFASFRATLLFIFRAELSSTPTATALFRLFETGLRSDTCVAMWAVLPSLILTLIGFFRPLGIWHIHIRRLLVVLVLSLCAIVFVSDVGYFAEYDSQFDHWIFGLLYDDRRAILSTIWKTYPIIPLVVISAITVICCAWAINKLCGVAASTDLPNVLASKWTRAVTVVVIGLWILTGTRVWPHYHLVTVKNAAGTGDVFLNKIALNPFFALRYAIWEHRNLQKVAGLRTILRDGDVRAAANALFPQARDAANLDDCLTRTAPGAAGVQPTQIFLVVMESYDAWSMQPEYAALNLTDRLKELGREGIYVRAFVSAGAGTMASLGTIITGLPGAGVLDNYQPAVRLGVPTAIARIFKELGYRTRFFCGASVHWERSGEFCREQGFEEVYGGDQMPARSGGNEWGVDDEDLFRFVLDHTTTERTFNLIMTSSYHAPYSVDLEKKGFDLKAFKANQICAGLSDQQARILGHLWYSDKSVGEFVSEGEKKFERPLFAITGDHYSRKKFVSVSATRALYDELAVPLIIYGPKVLEKVHPPAPIAGSHLDILPTLIDLAAPGGFVYHAFGRDLLDASQPQVGYGVAVIGPNFVFKIHNPNHIEDFRGQAVTTVDGKALALRYRQLEALGWWRAVKGNQWPTTGRGETSIAH